MRHTFGRQHRRHTARHSHARAHAMPRKLDGACLQATPRQPLPPARTPAGHLQLAREGLSVSAGMLAAVTGTGDWRNGTRGLGGLDTDFAAFLGAVMVVHEADHRRPAIAPAMYCPAHPCRTTPRQSACGTRLRGSYSGKHGGHARAGAGYPK